MADTPGPPEAVIRARGALKETVLNVERLVEAAERVLTRAQERLDSLDLDYPELTEER